MGRQPGCARLPRRLHRHFRRGRIPEGGVDTPLTLLSKKPHASSLQPSNEQLFCVPAGI